MSLPLRPRNDLWILLENDGVEFDLNFFGLFSIGVSLLYFPPNAEGVGLF